MANGYRAVCLQTWEHHGTCPVMLSLIQVSRRWFKRAFLTRSPFLPEAETIPICPTSRTSPTPGASCATDYLIKRQTPPKIALQMTSRVLSTRQCQFQPRKLTELWLRVEKGLPRNLSLRCLVRPKGSELLTQAQRMSRWNVFAASMGIILVGIAAWADWLHEILLRMPVTSNITWNHTK